MAIATTVRSRRKRQRVGWPKNRRPFVGFQYKASISGKKIAAGATIVENTTTSTTPGNFNATTSAIAAKKIAPKDALFLLRMDIFRKIKTLRQRHFKLGLDRLHATIISQSRAKPYEENQTYGRDEDSANHFAVALYGRISETA